MTTDNPTIIQQLVMAFYFFVLPIGVFILGMYLNHRVEMKRKLEEETRFKIG